MHNILFQLNKEEEMAKIGHDKYSVESTAVSGLKMNEFVPFSHRIKQGQPNLQKLKAQHEKLKIKCLIL